MSSFGLLGAVSTAGYVLGATAWFFFLQSPSLIKFMGKGKFIPVQMHLVKLLIRSLEVACLLNVAITATVLNSSPFSALLGSSLLAACAVVINRLLVVPRALESGQRSLRKDDHTDSSATGFAKDGGGDETKNWHRTVVACVVVMLVGTVVHLHAVVTFTQPRQ